MTVTIATPFEKNSSCFAGVLNNRTGPLVFTAEQWRSGHIAVPHTLTMSNSALVFPRASARQELPTATG
jgi:hypothetical protein